LATSQTPTPAAEHQHHPAWAHQFDDMEQQKEASSFAMWVFLLTEIMMFGGLFAAYLIYRLKYYDAWVAGSSSINVKWGFANTLVLIGSSFTMAMAVWAAQKGKRQQQVLYLVLTIVLGTVFLGVKAVEYKDKYDECHIPGQVIGKGFNATGGIGCSGEGANIAEELQHPKNAQGQEVAGKPAPAAEQIARQTEIFFVFYFAMTGLHATHMIIGIGVLFWLVWRAHKAEFGPDYYTPVENFGLYWHFVDIVWIYLFPLLYLINRIPHR
jgi:cytochrome c oxidase subunit III